MNHLNSRSLPERVDEAVQTLRDNQWDRMATAYALHINMHSLANLIRQAEADGITIYPDPNWSETRKRQQQNRKDGKIGLAALGRIEKEPENFETQHSVTTAEIEETHELYGGKINIQLARKNFSAARAMIDQAERDESRQADSLDPFAEIALAATGIQTRTVNALEAKANALWIGDLLKLRVEDLLLIKNFGTKALDDILQKVIGLAIERDGMRALAELKLKGMVKK